MPAPGETFVGAGLDTWAGSPFVQARLALLGKTVFLLSFGFFTVMNCVVILACLEKEPARRPASASELEARLQAIPLTDPWTRERAERWWSENAPAMSATRPVADVLLSIRSQGRWSRRH